MKRNYVWAAALLMLAACSNEEVLTTGDENLAGGEKVTVTATLPGNDSRVTLEDVTENGKNIIKVTWNESGEAFTVMTTAEQEVTDETNDGGNVFTQTEGDQFGGNLPAPVSGEPYYAIYPAVDMWTEDGQYQEGGYYNYWDPTNSCNITSFRASQVPFNIFFQDGTLSAANTLMYATSTDGSSFDFHHLTAIVKFTLTGLPTTLTGEEQHFDISWRGGCIPDGMLDLTQSTVADKYPADENSIGMVNVTVVPNDGTATFYAYLPPVAQGKTLTITAQCYDEDNVYLLSTEVNLTTKAIEAGKYYRAERVMTTKTISRNMTAGTVQELQAWLDNCQNYGLSFDLTLTDNITLTDADLDGDSENQSNWPLWLELRDATIDGGGHTLTGLKMNVTGDGVGAVMFHRIDETSVVKNLHLRGVELSSTHYYAAGVAADNEGTVSGCSVSGTISSAANGYYVGGVVGSNLGTVTACYSTGTVSATGGNTSVGGVVGGNSGTVTACYSTGTVSATGDNTFAGGVVGDNLGNITACYSTGAVSVTGAGEYAYAGGVAGSNSNNCTIKDCYWSGTGATTGIGHNYALSGSNNEGTTQVDGETVNWISHALTAMNQALADIADFGWQYKANTGTDATTLPLVLESTSANQE